MIKIYVFETVEDLKSYEVPAAQDPEREHDRTHEDVTPVAAEEEPEPPIRKKKIGKPVRKNAGKGYKKGVCGKCGEAGHSAWHCPERKPKAAKAKKQKPAPKQKAENEKHDPEKVRELARRVAAREMNAHAAAEKLGVSIAMWYYLKSKFAKDVRTEIHNAPQTRTINPDELREQISAMQTEGLTSLQIAGRLKVSLATVNLYWRKDAEQLAPPAADDLDETAIDDEAPPAIAKEEEDEEEIL